MFFSLWEDFKYFKYKKLMKKCKIYNYNNNLTLFCSTFKGNMSFNYYFIIIVCYLIKLFWNFMYPVRFYSNRFFEEYFNFKLLGDLFFKIWSFFCKWYCFFRSRSLSSLSTVSFFLSLWQKSAALSKIINFEALSDSASSGTQNFKPSKALLRSTLLCLSIELWRSLTSFSYLGLLPLVTVFPPSFSLMPV